MTVSVTDLQRPLAIATQTKVASPSPGIELHFLRARDLGSWRAHAERLQRSGAYASVELVRLTLHSLTSDQETQAGS
jgi:hypothetical protein